MHRKSLRENVYDLIKGNNISVTRMPCRLHSRFENHREFPRLNCSDTTFMSSVSNEDSTSFEMADCHRGGPL